MADVRMDAILLLGPTGVGKSPLGELLEARGWGGLPCRHFDFGRALRQAAAHPGSLSDEAQSIVLRVLRDGTLLEDHEFFVAEELLLARRRALCATAPMLVLNGLPRHVGQARDVERLMTISTVVQLEAPPDVLLARIQENRGGDRVGRLDDDDAAVAARLARYEARTRPLLAHYRERGVSIRSLQVARATQAADLVRALGV